MKTISSFQEFAEALLEFIHQSAADILSAESPELPTECRQHVDTQFNQLALALFALQFSEVAPYRRFCEARKVSPVTVKHWSEIPALPTSAFKEFEISSLPPEQRTHVLHSSGTTEQIPSRHFHSAGSLAIYEASLLPWFQKHFLADWDELAESEIIGPIDKPGFIFLTPSPALAPNSSLVHMFETVRRELGSRDSLFTGKLDGQKDGIVGQASSLPERASCPRICETGAGSPPGRQDACPTSPAASDAFALGQKSWALDIDQTLFALRKSMCANRPVAILGTAFSFVHLLDHFAANNIRYRLANGSRVLETGGYKGRSRSLPKAELHQLITKHFGIPASHIVCEYGMSELSSQAYDNVTSDEWRVTGNTAPPSRHPSPVTRHFQFPPWTRVQIISPETGIEVGEGEIGLIRIFDLANVYSVLAIQTEDLGIRRGSGFELVGRSPLVEPRGCSLMAT